MVNDGQVPCSVENKGNRRFKASFIPTEAVDHRVDMFFNNEKVPGEKIIDRNPVLRDNCGYIFSYK